MKGYLYDADLFEVVTHFLQGDLFCQPLDKNGVVVGVVWLVSCEDRDVDGGSDREV